jgi:hypothetical protein
MLRDPSHTYSSAPLVTLTRAMLVDHNACEDGLASFDRMVSTLGYPRAESITIPWCTLTMLMLCKASVPYLSWLLAQRLFPALTFASEHLSGLDLSNARFRSASFEGASLRNSDLRGSREFGNMLHVDLCGAQLAGACFCNADVSYAAFDARGWREFKRNGCDARGTDKVIVYDSGRILTAEECNAAW